MEKDHCMQIIFNRIELMNVSAELLQEKVIWLDLTFGLGTCMAGETHKIGYKYEKRINLHGFHAVLPGCRPTYTAGMETVSGFLALCFPVLPLCPVYLTFFGRVPIMYGCWSYPFVSAARRRNGMRKDVCPGG